MKMDVVSLPIEDPHLRVLSADEIKSCLAAEAHLE